MLEHLRDRHCEAVKSRVPWEGNLIGGTGILPDQSGMTGKMPVPPGSVGPASLPAGFGTGRPFACRRLHQNKEP